MRTLAAILLLLCAVCVTAFTQTASTPNTAAQHLFNLIRERVRSDLMRAPRYTCVQTIARTQYRPQYGGNRPNSCPALVEARASLASPGRVIWRDKLRFDVAVGDKGEMFSWAGAREFESNDLASIALSGSTGSGDFASFLSSVFGPEGEQFHYIGLKDTPFGLLSAFDFKVPFAKSHYTYRSEGKPAKVIGYEGSFYAVPETGELKRLIVEAKDFADSDDFCHVTDVMDYAYLKVGSGDFLLPARAAMTVLYRNGEESQNEKRYSNCREFTGTSTLLFDDPAETGSRTEQTKAELKALPAGTHIRVRIDPPVNTESAAAGDAITGVVEHDVRQKGQLLVRTTDKLRGRILRLEQFLVPEPRWIFAIRFEAIERDGIEQPMTFAPVDDGDRTRVPRTSRRGQPQLGIPERPKGAGIFVFSELGRLVLDRNFHSEWETR